MVLEIRCSVFNVECLFRGGCHRQAAVSPWKRKMRKAKVLFRPKLLQSCPVWPHISDLGAWGPRISTFRGGGGPCSDSRQPPHPTLKAACNADDDEPISSPSHISTAANLLVRARFLFPSFLHPAISRLRPENNHIYRGLEKSRQDAGTSCGDEFVSLTSLSCPAARPDGFLTVACTDTNAGERQTGRKAQLSNIAAAKTCVSPPRPRHRLRRIWKMDTRRGG